MRSVIVNFLFCFAALTCKAQGDTVSLLVDARADRGDLRPVWAWVGYDEPNYTYAKDGKKLLTELSALSPVPVHVRVHNLLTTGDGSYGLKWGSTNAYTEDKNGLPVYDWTIVDRIMDTFLERGMKPLAEIGFMPEALSSRPQPYRHSWNTEQAYGNIYTGWSYPPKDYAKWSELVFQWVKHSIARYGIAEVKSWYWEVWNEPNIKYWQGTFEEYCKLYDYSANAVKRACPQCTVGGPHSTGPDWSTAEKFLRDFLEHCTRGKNYVTGKTGSPLDFVAFHAKGSPKVVDGHVRMNMSPQLKGIGKGFEIVTSFPEYKDLPVIIGECDPEGCAACSMQNHPQNAYRNGTMYSSYTASVYARIYDLMEKYKVNLLGAVTWGFEFEDQRWFDGFRDLATNGVDKPVLNVFRMFGMMNGHRLAVSSTNSFTAEHIIENGVNGERGDVYGLASRSGNVLTIMVWNYHDDDLAAPDALVSLKVSGLDVKRALFHHYRIDAGHSNSYEAWKRMGSPQEVTPEQYKLLEQSGQLELLSSPDWTNVFNGTIDLRFSLPRQAVSLIRIEL